MPNGLPVYYVMVWFKEALFRTGNKGNCERSSVTRLDSKQVSSRLIPGQRLPSGFDDVPTLSTRYQRFICILLHSTYLTRSSLAFSLTLTTMAFDHSKLRWFGISTCIAIPRGQPSSSVQHSCCSSDDSCRLNAPSWRTIVGVAHILHSAEIGVISVTGREHSKQLLSK